MPVQEQAEFTRGEIKSLTSLRFVAAMMIVVYHFGAYMHWPKLGPLNLGHGVSFFFVLSGFVLQYAWPRIETSAEMRRFIALRLARIWPLHILCLAAPLLLVGLDQSILQHHPTFLLYHVLLLQSWFPIQLSTFSFNGPAWSISTEMFFYVMFPVLIWIRSPKALLLYFLLIAAYYLATIDIGCIGPANDGIAYDSAELSCFAAGQAFPLSRVTEFVAGIMLCRAFMARRNRAQNIPVAIATGVELAVIAVAAVYIWNLGAMLRLPLLDTIRPTLIYSLFLVAGSAPVFALVIFVFAFERGHISAALRYRPFVLLGEISFSVYLVHATVIKMLAERRPYFETWNMPLLFVCSLALILGTSYLTFTYFESPIRALAKRKFPKARQAADMTSNMNELSTGLSARSSMSTTNDAAATLSTSTLQPTPVTLTR